MRIDRLEITNFKKFSDYTIDLHPQFTLLVGDNGTGKTTILDALAIASVNHQGQIRPSFKVVEWAILHCIPEVDAIWYDSNLLEIVISIDRNP